MAMTPSTSTAQGNQTRRTLARVAGILIMIWGIGWALAWMAAAAAFAVLLYGQGSTAGAVGAVVGGLVLAGVGALKAAGGWILVKEDKKL